MPFCKRCGEWRSRGRCCDDCGATETGEYRCLDCGCVFDDENCPKCGSSDKEECDDWKEEWKEIQRTGRFDGMSADEEGNWSYDD